MILSAFFLRGCGFVVVVAAALQREGAHLVQKISVLHAQIFAQCSLSTPLNNFERWKK